MDRILDRINQPADLRRLSVAELKRLAREIRDVLVHVTTTQTGGHLASNLGVVELTLALHRVFNSPHDKIVWDVSHQVYVQKLIDGRRDRSTPSAPSAACPASPTAPKARTTSSAPGTPARPSPPPWVWPWRASTPARTTTSSPCWGTGR